MGIGMALGMPIRKIDRVSLYWLEMVSAMKAQFGNQRFWRLTTDCQILPALWPTITLQIGRYYLVTSLPSLRLSVGVKGFGCKRMENNPAWHHRAPTQGELAAILEELA